MSGGYVATEDLVWGDRVIPRGKPLPDASAEDLAIVHSVAVGLVAPSDEVDDGWEVGRRPLVIGERTMQPGERLRPEIRLDRSFQRLRELGLVRRIESTASAAPDAAPLRAESRRAGGKKKG